MSQHAFREVTNEAAGTTVPPPSLAASIADQQAAARAAQASAMLGLALKALGQRALGALAAGFSLVLAGSVFWLALAISSAPTNRQLITLGLYALFVLVLHMVRRQ